MIQKSKILNLSVGAEVANAPADKPITTQIGDLSKEFTEDSPPEVLIADGNISPEGLQAAGYTQKDLQKLLKKHQVEAEQVFLLTVKQNGLHCLVRKENSQ